MHAVHAMKLEIEEQLSPEHGIKPFPKKPCRDVVIPDLAQADADRKRMDSPLKVDERRVLRNKKKVRIVEQRHGERGLSPVGWHRDQESKPAVEDADSMKTMKSLGIELLARDRDNEVVAVVVQQVHVGGRDGAQAAAMVVHDAGALIVDEAMIAPAVCGAAKVPQEPSSPRGSGW